METTTRTRPAQVALMSLLFLVSLPALQLAHPRASCAMPRREIQRVTPIYCACPAKSHDPLCRLVRYPIANQRDRSARLERVSGCKCPNSRQTPWVLNEGTSRSPQQVNRATPEHPKFVQGFSTARAFHREGSSSNNESCLFFCCSFALARVRGRGHERALVPPGLIARRFSSSSAWATALSSR